MKLIVLIVIAAIAGLLLLRPVKAQTSQDSLVIAQLKKAGSNLSKPHEIEFFFYFHTKEAAEHVSEKLNALGFSAKAEPAAKGSDWLVLAKKSLVPTESALVELRSKFDAIAAEDNGVYDGWGTPVVK